MKTILVVGGAGYIGSHMVLALSAAGFKVVILDDLSTGHKKNCLSGEFICGTLADKNLLVKVFNAHRIDAVMHFASFIQVGESVQYPSKYYNNNVTNTLNLLDAMLDAKVSHLIFSSTAAIFGNPVYTPIDNQHPKAPINPYGRSKWFIEQILADYEQAYGLKSVSLRYFNAAGADFEGRIGECHQPETHLIPLILQVASGRRDKIKVMGNDYPTHDGTAIRDYIHVSDLCQAHLLALNYLLSGRSSNQFNLGNGKGFSVNEVIEAARKVTGHPIPSEISARRAGDPAVLVADATLAKRELGWQPQFQDLETIIAHAWTWEQKLAKL